MGRFSPPLLVRVALALAGVGLVPLAVASFQLVSLNRDAMESQVLRLHVVAARGAADRAVSFLDSLERTGEATARSPVWERGDGAQTRERLLDLLQADERIAGVVVTSAEGVEAFRVQRKELAAVVERVLKDPGAGPVVTLMDGPKVWLRREFLVAASQAHLRMVVDASELVRSVRYEELGQEAYLALASRDRIVAASVPSVSLTVFPPVLLANAASQKASGASRFRDAAGNLALGAWAPVNRPDVDWFALSRQPAAVAELVAIQMRRKAALAFSGALLLAGVFGYGTYRTVVRPLRELAQEQRRLAGRGGAAVSGDEIEDLKGSFKALEQRVKDQVELGTVFLGRYQVLNVIGSGGMGTVFRGFDPKLQRPVALKTIRAASTGKFGVPTPSISTRLVGELLTEAVLIARFSHPNIVSVYDVADEPDAAFIAMELVEGPSLEMYVKRMGLLAPSQCAAMGVAVASALAAAHAHRVIHHDIKPANVLLGADGSIKVTDFGIAEVLSVRAGQRSEIFGTPGYIPPETLQGKGSDEAADLFALGVLLYRCVTGSLPFHGKDGDAMMRATLSREPTTPASRVPRIPPELDGLIMRLLEKDRSKRPDKAAEIAGELERLTTKNGWRWSPERWQASKEVLVDSSAPVAGFFPTVRYSDRLKRG